MGITAIVASVIVAPILIYGTVKGIQYAYKVSREKNKTDLETKNTGENLAILHNEVHNEVKDTSLIIEGEDEVSKIINEIKNNKKEQYKMKMTITKEDNSNIHLEEENDNLNNINSTFNKQYSFSSNVIFISNFKNFDDSYFTKLMRIKWENLNELILPHNNITKINPLTNYPLINLEKIDLSYNLLEDIDDLEEVNMVKLNSVNFRNNKIDSPSTFINKIFYKLEYLNLLENNIDEMDKENFAKKYKKKNPNVELLL